MKLTKPTSLESSDNIADTLTWKIKRIEDDGLPIESGLADYVALAIGSLESRIDYIKMAQAQIAAEKKAIESQIKKIKNDGAAFFQDNGIEKVEGVFCSSVSVVSERLAKETTVTGKVFTPLIAPSEIEELLIGLGKAEMKTITTTKTSNHIPAALRITKRKTVAEVVE